MSQPHSPKQILIVAYDQCQALDVAGPAEVFAKANSCAGDAHYEISVAAARSGRISSNGALSIHADRDFFSYAESELAHLDTLIVVGGYDVNDAIRDATLLSFVRRAALHSRRVVSICTGAFVLAELGLLDGKRATTHWQSAEQLAEHYPRVSVEADAIYLHDDTVWTSAGITAGIDLALALVEEDSGRELALAVARELVVYMMRPGGQSQYSAQLRFQQPRDGRFAQVLEFVRDNPAVDHSVSSLAERSHMSDRNFARRFTREVGMTPARYVETVRLECARRALESTDSGCERIANECGLHSAEMMRRLFKRKLGISPLHYRQRFQTSLRNSVNEDIR